MPPPRREDSERMSRTLHEISSGYYDMLFVRMLAGAGQWTAVFLVWLLIIVAPFAQIDGVIYVIVYLPLILIWAGFGVLLLRDVRLLQSKIGPAGKASMIVRAASPSKASREARSYDRVPIYFLHLFRESTFVLFFSKILNPLLNF